MSIRFEISDVLSTIDNFLEKRHLHQKDPDMALKFVDRLKKMEVWFVSKVFIDSSRFMQKVVDLCQNGSQNDVRKFMAFARYSFRQLGPERFEDRVNGSCLTSRDKGIILVCFRIGEIDRAAAGEIAGGAEAQKVRTSRIFSEEPDSEVCCSI